MVAVLGASRAVERNRPEGDVEGEGAGLATVFSVGCEERGWPREDPALGFWLGSWVGGGTRSSGEQ